ncbi:hypothetical protein DPMN_022548 [Dreissena polymorpha]|uniref:Uncharacterized protein n=1 Tax=Dreissena polymorpha TaxID=45954 RepID=A0A9D4SBV6_DREPO|nr:hypothetical protein DPMN_022548 [Dreissena polymorpha]
MTTKSVLLERVIRNELALETTLSEIMKTNAKVVEGLKQLEDEKQKWRLRCRWYVASMISSKSP